MQKFLNWISKHSKGLLIGGIAASSAGVIATTVAEYTSCCEAASKSASKAVTDYFEAREMEAAMESDPAVEEHSEV